MGAIERKALELCHGAAVPVGEWLLDEPTAGLFLLVMEAGHAIEQAGRVHTPAHEVMLTDRPAMAVLSDSLMDQGDPLGEVLALWLAGKLEGRHVLGVETLEGEAVADLLNGKRGSTREGWRFVDCHSIDGKWQPQGQAYRPTLEANP